MAEGSLIEYKDLIGDDGTFEKLSAQIQKSKAELLDLAKVSKKAFGKIAPNDLAGMEQYEQKVKDIEALEKKLLKALEALNKAKKKRVKLTNEELIQREKEKLQQKERVQRAKQLAIISKEEKNNVASLRAQLALATLDWKKFTAAELKNTKAGKLAVKNKKNLTRQLKKLEKATGDNRRNVGNYSSALSGLNGIMLNFGGNVGATVGSLGGMLKGVRSATKGMKLLKLAIIGTGIGALVIAIIALVSYFKRSQKGIDAFNQGLAVVGAVVNVILDRFMKLGSALVAVFTGDFAGAMDIATDAVSGLGDEIARTAREALALEKAVQDLAKIELHYSRGIARDIAKIADLRREAKEIQDKDAKSALEKLQEAHRLQTGIEDKRIRFAEKKLAIAQGEFNISSKNIEELKKVYDAEIAVSKAQTTKATALRGLQREMNTLVLREEANRRKIAKAIEAQKKGLEELSAEAMKASLADETARQKSAELRFKAINKVIKEVENLEAQGIEDKQERLLSLEKLRFEAETELRESQFETLKANSKNIASELEALTELSDRKKEQQETDHLTKMAGIRKEFMVNENAERQTFIDQQDAENEAEEAKAGAISDRKVAAALASDKKIAESNKKLIKDISDSATKVGEIIVDLFSKQADLSEESVNEQSQNLERARDRAAKGLQTNLAFEEQELAKRQLEQQRRQKEAEQAARILTLFNLVSAYAAGGDKNALARGLIDFSLLTALSAGFEEGGFTGKDGSNSTVKGLVHANEYVVTAEDTARFGLTGKSGGDFGEAMGDYFNPQSPVQINPYPDQREAFKQDVKVQHNTDNSEMVKELRAIKSHLSKQPNIGIEIEKVYENVYAMIKSESKQNLTKISKKFLRGK